MSTEWTAYPFKDALATAVAARSGITSLTQPSVKVLTFFPGAEEPWADSIILGYNVRDTKELVTVGGQTHDETVDLVSQIRVVRPGGGQAVATTVEARARVMLAEVDDELRTETILPGERIINPRISDRESILFSWKAQDGTPTKVCIIEFTVRYRGKTTA